MPVQSPPFPVARPWGKLCRAADGTVTAALPLGDHMADVAAVLEALLDIPVVRARLARLGGLDDLDPGQTARLCVLAALHDIGKTNHGFQAKALPRGTAPVEGHVACTWRALCDGPLWDALGPFADAATGWFRDQTTAWEALKAVLAHHGSPPADPFGAAASERALWAPADGYAPLVSAATLAGEALAWFPAHTATARRLPDAAPFWHAVAGLVTLADRLGSDETAFTYPHGPADGEPRIAFARRTAAAMVGRRFLRPDAARAAAAALPWSFGALFPDFRAPAFAQAVLLDAPPPDPAGSLAILEAETGSGKTEAALIHFLRLFRTGAVDGVYVALPTRASAVQIHGRLRDGLLRLLGAAAPPAVLAVPGYLRVDAVEGAPLPGFGVTWPDDEEGTLRDRGWAAEHPSRYLAGAVVVGTVDQVLLAGLDVKHSRLRAAALQRLLLVVDEVHASDSYMLALLTNVLRIHTAAGGHALLMSATLGACAHAALMAASSGLRLARVYDTRPLPFAEAVARPYPLVTGLGQPVSRDLDPRAEKTVAVALDERFDAPEHIAGLAHTAADRGARVLVIVNTVGRAMALQAAVEAAAPDAGHLFAVAGRPCPHHARFAAQDRRRLDAAVEARFGRTSATPVVLLATQTVEQSLDIDADLLITDLAPADVLLQRLGRLHRHRDRTRPAGFAAARAIVLAPPVARLGAALEHPGRLRLGYGNVYPNLVGLAATRLALDQRPTLTLPADNRALVEAATHDDHLRGLATTLGDGWVKALNRCIGDQGVQRGLAVAHRVDWTGALAPVPRALQGVVGTRLGVNDRLAAFPDGTVGPFGRPVSTIRLPGWMLPEGCDGDPCIAAVERPAPDCLMFRFAGVAFAYGRLGLSRVDDHGA